MSKVEKNKVDRFFINPIEVLIATALGAVFIYSLYQLLYEEPGDHKLSALVSMKANPISEGRKIASMMTPPLVDLELDCSKGIEPATKASKARIRGSLCGFETHSEGQKLTTATIVNESNHFTATVFAQNDSDHFSTDYIPLITGENKIHVEFSYGSSSHSYSKSLIITRN